MVWWGVIWGAVIGWALPGGYGLLALPGALLGLLAGLTLRAAVRNEVRAMQARDAQSAVHPPHTAQEAQQPVEPRAASQQETPASRSAAAATPFTPAITVPPAPIARASVPPVAASDQAASTVTSPPSPAEKLARAVRDWFMGGNTVVRVGVVILFIGLSFLANYAARIGLFPVELRLASIGAVGMALLAVGFRVRASKPAYSMTLQGAGVAVMYLTVFAAYRMYQMIPMGAAFALMVGVCALSVALALLQNARALAFAAFAGGFATPILVSTGQGNHVALFSYYTVLNLAILFIAFKRAWRELNILGFISTFGVATTWGVLRYQPEHYASAQAFLILFCAIYVFAAVLYARTSSTQLARPVDSMLVFGTPLIGFGLQAGLVRGFELGTAFSALAAGAFYLLLAWALARRARPTMQLLVECFLALGVGFATLAVPLALDARWTAAVWAAEGAGAFWVGTRQARWMPRAFGLALQVVAALSFLASLERGVLAPYPFANPAFIGAMLLAVPALAIAWWTRRALPHSGSSWALGYAAFEKALPNPAYLYGFVWVVGAIALEVMRRLPVDGSIVHAILPAYQPNLLMLAFVLCAAASSQVSTRLNWPVAGWPANAVLPVLFGIFAINLGNGTRVFEAAGWIIWPVCLALHAMLLHRADARPTAPLGWRAAVHAAGVWLVVLLCADVLWFAIEQGGLWRTAWATVVVLVSGTLILLALAAWAGGAQPKTRWPLHQHQRAYAWVAAAPLAVLVFGLAIAVAVGSAGNTRPLPYVPLLNPTDLAIALALVALAFWRLRVQAAPIALPALVRGRKPLVALAIGAFIAINTVWLRIAYHFFDVPWSVGDLFGSFVVQTGYAILWTLLAVALMLTAHKRAARPLWMLGAGLLALTVVKLLFIDLSNAGGGERIIAFVAVGALMLVVGYLAPIPPASAATPREHNA